VYGFRWERWSALAGVLFAVLFVVGMILITFDTPTGDDGEQKIGALASR